MEQSVRSGFGLGFAFWALSISLVNRVLIQGVSRASIGKKLFKLELIASGEPITWTTMLKRWVVSVGSVAAGGFGYWYAFFNEERKTLHDLIAGTDVVPMFQSPSVSMEYSEQTRSFEEIRQILVPEAVVPAVVAEVVAEVVSEKATLADVISIQEWKKGDAENQSENQDEKKRAA
jgi:hypothetical protein